MSTVFTKKYKVRRFLWFLMLIITGFLPRVNALAPATIVWYTEENPPGGLFMHRKQTKDMKV